MNDSDQAASFPNLLVVIGASAGGLTPIREILSALPRDFQAVVMVATHRDPRQKTNALADILDNSTRMRVEEPVEGKRLQCTCIYVGMPSESVEVDGRLAHIKPGD